MTIAAAIVSTISTAQDFDKVTISPVPAGPGVTMLDPNTKIIPGHGPLTDVAGLRKYRDVLADVAAKVETAVKAGKTREEVVAMKPSAAYDETWGKGFIKPDTFATLLYDSFANAK